MLYADDALVFIYKDEVIFPNLLTIVNKFGHLSGGKVNWDKSEILNINKYALKVLLSNWDFQWKNGCETNLDKFSSASIHLILLPSILPCHMEQSHP